MIFSYNLATGNSKKKPIDPQSLMDVSPLRVLADTLDDVKTVYPFSPQTTLHGSLNTPNKFYQNECGHDNKSYWI